MFPRSSPSAPPRFICPHCRSSLDPAVLDEAVCGAARYRICPECDGAVALAVAAGDVPDVDGMMVEEPMLCEPRRRIVSSVEAAD